MVAIALGVAAPFGINAITRNNAHAATPPPSVPYSFNPTQYSDGLLVSRRWTLTGDGSNFTASLVATNTTSTTLPTSFVEVIPESLAKSSSDIHFDPVPLVVEPDPVVKYNLTLPPLGKQTLTYTIHTSADGANLDRLEHWADDWEKAVAATSVPEARAGKAIVLKSLTVSPSHTTDLVVGGSIQLTVSGTNDDGSPASAATLAAVAWTSSKNDVATVGNTGQVLGHGAGTTTITAQIGTTQGEATVTVVKPAKTPSALAVSGPLKASGGSSSTPGKTETTGTTPGSDHTSTPVTTAPGLPPSVVASSVTSPMATITWGTPTDGGAGISGYRVSRDGSDRAGPGTWTIPDPLPASQHSFRFEQLQQNTTYHLSVWALDRTVPAKHSP